MANFGQIQYNLFQIEKRVKEFIDNIPSQESGVMWQKAIAKISGGKNDWNSALTVPIPA